MLDDAVAVVIEELARLDRVEPAAVLDDLLYTPAEGVVVVPGDQGVVARSMNPGQPVPGVVGVPAGSVVGEIAGEVIGEGDRGCWS